MAAPLRLIVRSIVREIELHLARRRNLPAHGLLHIVQVVQPWVAPAKDDVVSNSAAAWTAVLYSANRAIITEITVTAKFMDRPSKYKDEGQDWGVPPTYVDKS